MAQMIQSLPEDLPPIGTPIALDLVNKYMQDWEMGLRVSETGELILETITVRKKAEGPAVAETTAAAAPAAPTEVKKVFKKFKFFSSFIFKKSFPTCTPKVIPSQSLPMEKSGWANH